MTAERIEVIIIFDCSRGGWAAWPYSSTPIVGQNRGKNHAACPIEQAAMAWKNPSRVLHAGTALERRARKVAQLRQYTDCRGKRYCLAYAPFRHQRPAQQQSGQQT